MKLWVRHKKIVMTGAILLILIGVAGFFIINERMKASQNTDQRQEIQKSIQNKMTLYGDSDLAVTYAQKLEAGDANGALATYINVIDNTDSKEEKLILIDDAWNIASTKGQWEHAVELSRKRVTADASIESYRMLALSYDMANDKDSFMSAQKKLIDTFDAEVPQPTAQQQEERSQWKDSLDAAQRLKKLEKNR